MSAREPELWGWILDADGNPCGWRRRALSPGAEARWKAAPGLPVALHHAPNWRERLARSGTLLITESPEKANIASVRLGVAAIASPTVHVPHNVLGDAIKVVREHRPSRVLLAPDLADLTDGEQRHDPVRTDVRSKWKQLARAAEDIGVEVRWLAWDSSLQKGIDDALIAGLEVEYLEWSEYLARWRWHGEPPAVAEDRPRSTSFGEVNEAIRSAIRTRSGGRSRWISAPPGSGKTTAALESMLEDLASRGAGCSVLALPTRADVEEKADAAENHETRLPKAPDSRTNVVKLLGASPDQDSGWWCESFDTRQRRAALHQFGCAECPVRKQCGSKPGRHRYEVARAIRLIRTADSQPVLAITTVAGLSWLLEGESALPDDASIYLDDSGLLGGLLSRIEIDVGDLEENRDTLDQHHSAVMPVAIDVAMQTAKAGKLVIPYAILERLIDGIARWLRDRSAPDPSALLEEIPEPVRIAIAEGRAHPERIEDPADEPRSQRLDLACAALRIARAQLHGYGTTATRQRGKIVAHVPIVELLNRVRAGRVIWLSVGELPAPIAAALGVDVVRIEAHPEQQTIVAVTDRNYGSGSTRQNDPLVHELWRALTEATSNGPIAFRGHRYGVVGAILHKRDVQALGEPDNVESFGRHAAHDRLSHVELLVVRRWAMREADLHHEAIVLARLLGLPEPAGEFVNRTRSWRGQTAKHRVRVPVDPLLAGVAAYHDRHAVLNAIGRVRSLTATSPRCVLLLERPRIGLDDVFVDEERSLPVLTAELGLRLDAPASTTKRLNEAREMEAAENADRIAGVLSTHGAGISDRKLAELAGVGVATANRHRRALPAPRDTLFHTPHIYIYRCVERFVSPDEVPSSAAVVDHLPVEQSGAWDIGRAKARRYVSRLLHDLTDIARDGIHALGRVRNPRQRRLTEVSWVVIRLQDKREDGPHDPEAALSEMHKLVEKPDWTEADMLHLCRLAILAADGLSPGSVLDAWNAALSDQPS